MAQKKNILVVEDEKALATILQLKLQGAGFEVEVVGDGEAAVQRIGTKKPIDLILLDLMLPKVDGFGVLEELKRQNIHIPVIVVTALSQDEDRKKVMSYGVKEYLVKTSVSLVDIVVHVKKYLE